jgi:hypothetical protein
MDAAVASLLGAVAGGSATFVGTVITNVSQSRRDERKAQQTLKAEAYGNALRNLLLVLHLRSGLTSRRDRADSSERRNIEAIRRLRWELCGRPGVAECLWKSRSGLLD